MDRSAAPPPAGQIAALARRTAAPLTLLSATVAPQHNVQRRLPRLFLVPPLSGPSDAASEAASDATRHASAKIVAHTIWNGNTSHSHAARVSTFARSAAVRSEE